MQIILESLFSMTSKKATRELTAVVERLVPLPYGKSIVWKYFWFIPNLSGKVEDTKSIL